MPGRLENLGKSSHAKSVSDLRCFQLGRSLAMFPGQLKIRRARISLLQKAMQFGIVAAEFHRLGQVGDRILPAFHRSRPRSKEKQRALNLSHRSQN